MSPGMTRGLERHVCKGVCMFGYRGEGIKVEKRGGLREGRGGGG